MLYRRFGRTEEQISAFSLGTMRLVHHSEEQARQVLRTALQAGINHLETAQAYGDSESQLGRILQGMRLEAESYLRDLILTTKVSPSLPSEDLWRAVVGSLTRLQVDSIDNLAFHGINCPEHLDHVLRDTLPVLDRMRDQGLVHHIGFSTHGSVELLLEAIETDEFEFIGLHYYYFNQRNAPALSAAARRDMGTFIISPADKGGMLYRPSLLLTTLCSPYDPLEFGYRFLLDDPIIHTLSLGAETPADIRQAVEAVRPASDWPHQRELILCQLETVLQNKLGTDRCAQCYACLPCPESIPIPEILRLRNLAEAYDMSEYGQYRYNMLGQAGHWFPGSKGDRCSECGDCLPRCPERLSIPQLLFDAHTRLDRSPIRRLWE